MEVIDGIFPNLMYFPYLASPHFIIQDILRIYANMTAMDEACKILILLFFFIVIF